MKGIPVSRCQPTVDSAPATRAVLGDDSPTMVHTMSMNARRASEWTIHGERVVDDTRHAVLSIAEV